MLVSVSATSGVVVRVSFKYLRAPVAARFAFGKGAQCAKGLDVNMQGGPRPHKGLYGLSRCDCSGNSKCELLSREKPSLVGIWEWFKSRIRFRCVENGDDIKSQN
jgi:hypothetical protein